MGATTFYQALYQYLAGCSHTLSAKCCHPCRRNPTLVSCSCAIHNSSMRESWTQSCRSLCCCLILNVSNKNDSLPVIYIDALLKSLPGAMRLAVCTGSTSPTTASTQPVMWPTWTPGSHCDVYSVKTECSISIQWLWMAHYGWSWRILFLDCLQLVGCGRMCVHTHTHTHTLLPALHSVLAQQEGGAMLNVR